MPVAPAIVRDSFIGTFVYYASGRRFFTHPEEQPGFVLPDKYFKPTQQRDRSDTSSPEKPSTATISDSAPPGADSSAAQPAPGDGPHDSPAAKASTLRLSYDHADLEKDGEGKLKHTEGHVGQPQDNEIVDWYGPDDPECPQNVRLPFNMTA